ncbi:MAG: response regulator [Lachnospiraceae bacterium]
MIKMILADDEPVISRGIQKLMDWASLGIEITGIYEDGKSAFHAIVCDKPDLVLLDISMPGMTGIDILKECSSMKLKTKIIFISGFQDFEYAKSALTYGAVDYLLKPVIREELMNALEKCLFDEKLKHGQQGADAARQGSVFDVLEELRAHFLQMTGLQLFFIIGPRVEHMSEIPGAYERCLEQKGYAFFADEITSGMISTEREVFGSRIEMDRFERVRSDLISALTGQDKDACEHCYEQLARLICRMAEGKKEDACFHFCSTIRRTDERMRALGLREQERDTRELLEQARKSVSYTELTAMFHDIVTADLNAVQKIASNSEMQNLIKAKEYIETHYNENLTLQVMAEQIHMNPSYFSVFFKKNSGENFKDYVSRVRLDHAMPLLISSNKKTYEIAIEVGFSDARNFADAFQRVYKETPNSFRKRIRAEQGE